MKHADLQTGDGAVALPATFASAGEHPQLEVPFTAIVGSRPMQGRSLSLTRAEVSGTVEDGVEGTVELVALTVNFSGFALLIYVDCWVERSGTEPGVYTLQFTDPMGEHAAPLRHLLNSYIAGDVVTLGGMMGYLGPLAVKGDVQAAAPGPWFRIRNILRRGFVAVLTVGLALVALHLAHQRVFFSYEGRPVTVTEAGQTLMATDSGQLTYVDPEAGKGEVVYAILANSGEYLSVKMPCDCAITPLRSFVEGATVLRGTPIVRLASGAGGLVANTEISAEGAVKLVGGHAAELVMADGSVVPVQPEILPSPEDGKWSVRVEMTLDDTADVSVGDVGRLRFRRSILPRFLK